MHNWLSSAEALALLNVRAQTLYANVSRGKVRTKADPNDSRKSLYHAGDIARLSDTRRGPKRIEELMSEATGWGQPIMATSISTVANDTLLYRAEDAVGLSKSHSLESIASLLWRCKHVVLSAPASTAGDTTDYPATLVFSRALSAISQLAYIAAPSLELPLSELQTEAKALLSTLICSAFGSTVIRAGGDISAQISHAWQRPQAETHIRQALCLLADHELNASTFATRVVISTGASLASGVLAGLSALGGPLHGRATQEFNSLVCESTAHGAQKAVSDWLTQKKRLPGFGHPLYPNGDARALAILQGLPRPDSMAELEYWGTQLSGEHPNIDYALGCLALVYDLPGDAPLALYIASRCVGWLAHALEQVENGNLIRPRARFIN
ncbi:citrate synthase [Ectopseudomonas mendocina]|uniref:citrate synthase (unknown stereospecificity) n=1 Tax=Ectopseudomonas mendocina TaxID=300 RepID=A0ABZ2RQQ6_ECTME